MNRTKEHMIRAADSRQLIAVIYTRVSKDKQKQSKSVQEQEEHGRSVVERYGWTLYRVYSDNDRPAGEGSAEREDWEQLRADLEAGKFDVLVVFEPSRATRDTLVYIQLIRACRDHGVKICADGNLYDPENPYHAAMLQIFFAVAELEREMTRKRVTRTVNARARDGAPAPGKAPFGYKRIYDGAARLIEKQIPDDDPRDWLFDYQDEEVQTPAGLVRLMFHAVAKGEHPYALANLINDAGIPNPRTMYALETHKARERKYASDWNPRVIRNLLANRAYLGSRLHRGKLTKTGWWPALVEERDFNTIAFIFSGRKRSSPRPAAEKRLLSGILICDACGRSTSASVSNEQPIYRCTQGHATVLIADADAVVSTWCVNWLTQAENIAQLRAVSGQTDELAEAQSQLLALLAEEEEWIKHAARIPARAQAVFWDDHNPKVQAVQDLIQTLGIPPVLHELVASDEPYLAWRDMSLPSKKDVINRLCTIRLIRVGKGQRIPADQKLSIARKKIRHSGDTR